MAQYKFDHIHLISPEPLKASEFYEKAFDARRTKVTELADGRTMVTLNLNGLVMVVYNLKPGIKAAPKSVETGYGLDHFGLVVDNIETAVARVKAIGVKFRDEITQFSPTLKLAFFWGPDNVLIELIERS